MTAPDYAEPIVGWRAWHVVRTDEGLRLHSISRRATWIPGTEHAASCLRRRSWRERFAPRPPHTAPSRSCDCGVWAVRSPERALSVLDVYGRSWRPVHRVLGTVALWGDVVEHEGGWRAALAYPRSVLVPIRRLHGPPVEDCDALIEGLAPYGVPVLALDGGSRAQLRRALAAAAP